MEALQTSLSDHPCSIFGRTLSTLYVHVSPCAHSAPQRICEVSAAYRFVVSVAVTNSAREANVPIWKVATLLADFLDTKPMRLVEIGL